MGFRISQNFISLDKRWHEFSYLFYCLVSVAYFSFSQIYGELVEQVYRYKYKNVNNNKII